MAKHLLKPSSTTGKPQRPRSVSWLVGVLIVSMIALAAASAGCSSSDKATDLTEAEAKAFLDDFAPEYIRMTIEMFDRALVGHTESAIVSKEHQITDFDVACPGGGAITFTVESVSVPTAGVNGSPNFVATATSTTCRVLFWEVEVLGTLPTTLEVIPDGHQLDASGMLRVRLPNEDREFELEVRELTATITSAGTCYSADQGVLKAGTTPAVTSRRRPCPTAGYLMAGCPTVALVSPCRTVPATAWSSWTPSSP